jgi:hypothetical protein
MYIVQISKLFTSFFNQWHVKCWVSVHCSKEISIQVFATIQLIHQLNIQREYARPLNCKHVEPRIPVNQRHKAPLPITCIQLKQTLIFTKTFFLTNSMSFFFYSSASLTMY